jgi:hypothetical protein
MNYHNETLGARLTRLLEANLRDPTLTQSILERLTEQQREQPQPRNRDPELRQASLFEAHE